MTTRQIIKFLDDQKDIPRTLHDKFSHTHTGRWPTWRARSLKRDGDKILEVATWRREKRNRFVVLEWFWSETAKHVNVGVKWRSYSTLKEALTACQEHTFRIDAVHVDLRA